MDVGNRSFSNTSARTLYLLFNKHGGLVAFDLNATLAGVTVLQVITIAIAVVGAVLGVINTWASLDKSRVKLRVVPGHAIPYGGAPQHIGMSIDITNLSAFAVTVDEVGLLHHGTRNRSVIGNPILPDDGKWPRRLEPRSSITIYSQRPDLTSHRIKCAYARTQCGVIETGNSPALRQMARGE